MNYVSLVSLKLNIILLLIVLYFFSNIEKLLLSSFVHWWFLNFIFTITVSDVFLKFRVSVYYILPILPCLSCSLPKIQYCVFCSQFVFFLVSLSSWIFARKWPVILQGPHLRLLCGILNLSAWMVVISPVVVLISWGWWLIVILGRDIIGLAVIMGGTALLLAFYSIMLWWRTQWQSSSMYSVDLFIVELINLLVLATLIC